MIVQELREIQERHGWLPPAELRALAQRLNEPLHRIHEVASYYPLYRLAPPPEVAVKVCRDMACHLAGAPQLTASLAALAQEFGPGQVHVGGVSCLGQCDRPVALTINDHHVYRGVSEARARALVRAAAAKDGLPHEHVDNNPPGWRIDVYGGAPRYEAVRQYLAGGAGAAAGLIGKLEVANLRGMGGAGFPTFRKWAAVRGAAGAEKFVVCNADESEPGTFKDRELLRRTPWLVLEGMILAALVVGARRAWLYVRHEYVDEIAVLETALAEARRAGVVGDDVLGSGLPLDVQLYVSPGGYVQGEESALLEAIEDRRGEPRNKPPFPVFNGLYNKPTVINNVETLAWVPAIALNGGAWYRDQGVNGEPGLRFVSVSGDVARPGVFEVPFGLKVKELLFDPKYCGGLRPGRSLKAFAPSGPSGGFLPPKVPARDLPPKFVQERLQGAAALDLLEAPLGLNYFAAFGGMLGAAHVVYDDTRDLVENALNCTEFYRNESCGKCVPCRVGSQKLTDLIGTVLQRRFARTQLPLVGELAQAMSIASICGLGQVASNPMATVIKYFPGELDRYLGKVERRAADPPGRPAG